MNALLCRVLGHRWLTIQDPHTWAPVDTCERCWRRA